MPSGGGGSSGAAATGGGGTPPSGGTAASGGGGAANGGGTTTAGSSSGGTTAGSGGGGATAGSGGGGTGGAADLWVGTWACAPQTTEESNLPPSPGLSGNTLRQMVRVSRGGSRLRLRLSNKYGTAPVVLSSTHVARSQGGGAIDTASDKALSFNGASAVTIPAGQLAWSDPFDFALAPLESVAISIHFGAQTGAVTGHPGSRTTSFLQTGNAVTTASLASAVKTEHWYFITGLDVLGDAGSGAVVVLGDSITDGRGSTTDKNTRWPDYLATRLQANPATSKVGVLNMGIGGNAVLSEQLGPPGIIRFEHDVLQQSGVRWLIVLEGVNDLGTSTDPMVTTALIDAYKGFVTQAKAANVRAYGVPILPIGGSQYAGAESARKTVNDWIRTSNTFDAVIDLDAAVRDPANPTQLLGTYDSGDKLHLSPAGYQKMADAVDLTLLTP
jgi:lysophospholipase L1-like esterase